MYILLAAATKTEIQETIESQGLKAGHSAPGASRLHNVREIGVLLTGIGSIPATWSLMREIHRRRPDCIIQAGIAGCFVPGRIGEAMVIKAEVLGDVGVHEQGTFKSVFDLRLMDKDQAPFTNGQLVNPYDKWLDSSGLPQVRAITINEISTSAPRIDWYQQNIAPVVESMEGAALHYVCLRENIPFLQLRAVSNDIGQRDKSKWDFKSSIARLNARLGDILQHLTPDLITR